MGASPGPRVADLPSPHRPVAVLDLTGPVPVVTVEAPDWLDASTAPGVEEVLLQGLDARPQRLAVDLTRCVMADLYGLGMLARVRASAAESGTDLCLVGANRRVRRVLDLAGLRDALPIRSLEAVLAG